MRINGKNNDGLTEDRLPAWYEDMLGESRFPLAWKEGDDPVSWREKAAGAYRAALIEELDTVDPEPRVLSVEQRAGYAVMLVDLALGRHRRSNAFLAIPDGDGPFPAALLLHDHGAFFEIGKEKVIVPFAGHPKLAISRDWMARSYGGRSLGDWLAGSGWVVFAADALGWGERDCGGYEHQQAIAGNLFNLGSSWAGLIAAEDAAAAAYLSSVPKVDPSRMAAIGFSMGGFRSFQVSSLSSRIRASVAVCCCATLASLMQPGGNRTRGQSAFTTTHPGLFRLLDMPDLASVAAPKPLLAIHGTEDRLFPEAGVQSACEKISAVYRAFGAEDNFRSILRPGGHEFTLADQEKALAWLRESFRI